MYRVVYYETARGDQPVALFLEELDIKTRAKVVRCLDDLLAVYGPNLIRPYADIVRGKIRELRVRFSSNSVRVFYFFFIDKEIVFLHSLLKKTSKIDPVDIDIAEKRMLDWINRNAR